MSADPRLRILDAGSGPLAQQMLAALDTTEIVIKMQTNLPPTARVGGAALAAMTARLFRQVRIDCPDATGTAMPPNWWGAQDIAALAAAANALLPEPEHAPTIEATLTIAVGLVDGEVDFGIGGGDFTAVLDRAAVAVDDGRHHLGLHAAAALAVSQLLGKALGDAGPRIVELTDRYSLDLISHLPADATPTVSGIDRPRPRHVVFAGAGSVGTSLAALVATALGPAYTGSDAAVGVQFTVIDLDAFDATRNPFRYPALRGGEDGDKATALADALGKAGLSAVGVVDGVGNWVRNQSKPGVDGLVISSVDTVEGRAEVADILARETLSIGVKALELHVQRERMDGIGPCPFCHYVDLAPAMTQADVYVEMTGINQGRMLQLLNGDKLTADDIAIVAATGKISGDSADLLGRRVADLIGRVYADAPIPTADGSTGLTIAFPQVSWFAGVLGAVELVKQLEDLPTLPGRVDVDLGGLPPGAVRVMDRDDSGRCLCHSDVRRRAWTRLYGQGEPKHIPGAA